MLYIVVSARHGVNHVTSFYADGNEIPEQKARGLIPAGYALRYVARVIAN